jgi:hypothetical protein
MKDNNCRRTISLCILLSVCLLASTSFVVSTDIVCIMLQCKVSTSMCY